MLKTHAPFVSTDRRYTLHNLINALSDAQCALRRVAVLRLLTTATTMALMLFFVVELTMFAFAVPSPSALAPLSVIEVAIWSTVTLITMLLLISASAWLLKACQDLGAVLSVSPQQSLFIEHDIELVLRTGNQTFNPLSTVAAGVALVLSVAWGPASSGVPMWVWGMGCASLVLTCLEHRSAGKPLRGAFLALRECRRAHEEAVLPRGEQALFDECCNEQVLFATRAAGM